MHAKGVLLYGPPGTGKTMIARAIAQKMDVCYLELKSGELMSKWLGESEANIRKFYALVNYLLPCIVFIDEIDSLAGRRSNDSETPESRRGISNTILSELENKVGLFMVGATNFPWQIDPAFLRRMGRRCYVPLPNEKQRYQLVKNHLDDVKHSLLEFDIQSLAKKLEGYSASDIVTFLKDVKARALRKIYRANFFVELEDGQWFPCSGLNPLAKRITFQTLYEMDANVLIPNLTIMDFELTELFQVSTNKDLDQYEEFSKNFGITHSTKKQTNQPTK